MKEDEVSTEALLAAARKVRADFSKRTLDSWIAAGLIATPWRGAGRKMYVSKGQEILVHALADMRRTDGKKVLDWQRALVVLYFFLACGEDTIPLTQVQQAWSTWVMSALLPPTSKRSATLTERLDRCDRMPALHRLRTSAHMGASKLTPDTRHHPQLASALLRLYIEGSKANKAFAGVARDVWSDADPALREYSIRGYLQVQALQSRALANADVIDEAYWRWVRPVWLFNRCDPIPQSLLSIPQTVHAEIDHVGFELLTVFGLVLSFPAHQWNGLPTELRPTGLYRPSLPDD